MTVSSAKGSALLLLRMVGRSFMYMTNNKGPMALPWGTPVVTGLGSERHLLTKSSIT